MCETDKNPPKVELKIEANQDSTASNNKITYVAHADTVIEAAPSVSFRPAQAPALPPHFVPRPEVMTELTQWALSQDTSSHGILSITAVRGLGGIGKSTLATALAHDPEVRKRFTDGILWATLGQEPNLLSLLNGWIKALGDYQFQPTTIEEARPHLLSLLADKTVLLVVDDAWNIEHIEAFRVGSSHCRILVTTREVQIPGATRFDLDVMTEEQSLAMLARQFGHALSADDTQHAATLAKTVGYLPLALELSAVQIADGVTWVDLISELQAQIADLSQIESPGADVIANEFVRKRYSLRASFTLSLKRLSTDQQAHFAWLGILPEDALITFRMARTLWNLTERDTKKILQDFYRRSFLTSAPAQDDGTPSYRLHDLMHDFARTQLTCSKVASHSLSLPGLGLSLTEAHRTLLNRYQSRLTTGLWHTLPKDGYIHEHLFEHLKQAGRFDMMQNVLQEETPEQRNAWYLVRESLGETAGFISDIMSIWGHAAAQTKTALDQKQNASTLGQEIRYVIILASINSLASNVSVELITALVKNKLWTYTQGLAYARRKEAGARRVEALNALIPLVPTSFRNIFFTEVLSSIDDIQDAFAKAQALTQITEQLAQQGQHQQAIQVANTIQDDDSKTQALTQIAEQLAQQGQHQQAIQVANTIQSASSKAKALTQIAEQLAQQGQHQQAIQVANTIQSASSKAKALTQIAEHLEQPQRQQTLQQAIQVANTIRDRYSKAPALTQIAEHLEQPQRQQTLQQAIQVANTIQDDDYKAQVLTQIAEQLAQQGQHQQAIQVANTIQDDYVKTQALTQIAEHLEQPQRQQTLQQAIQVVYTIQDDDSKAQALTQIAEHLEQPQRQQTLQQAIQVVNTIQNDYSKAKALTQIAEQLALTSQELISPVWNTTIRILSSQPRSTVLQCLPSLILMARNFGGAEAAEEAIAALYDVCRWWP